MYIRTIVNVGAVKTFIRKQKRLSQPWITVNTLKSVDKRRAAKASGNRQAANMISREHKRAMRKDKEAYYQRMCLEMEKEHLKGRSI